MGRFVEVCRRRRLKFNAGKSKVMVFVCVLDKSGTDEAEGSRMVASGRRVAGSIRSFVNARGLQLQLGIVERMENDRIAKSLNVGVCAGSRSLGSRGKGGLIL